ncbi:MAG: Gfo/Idh/MocA family oxidoreductase [Clostridia bacterium]|nr:Gfo/Idh/MocA family oxidoreductase [Clostridia bacterium]MDD6039910.1 Gfo/Idh/MocA family oxidoreductase [Clostridia bacterium]
MKQLTVAIAGCGSRGQDTYAKCQERFPDKMKIVAAADIRPEKLEQLRAAYGLTEQQCYDSAESMLKAGKLADVMFICTPDDCHYAHAMEALSQGYHLLLEKPISPTEEQCRDIERLANEKGLHVAVCHVLRYTVFYQKIKELIESGVVGEVVNIQANEQVAYWHQAHSFVRGNWRNAGLSSPMILAKCCHDMDILLWLAGKHCLRVSSFGSLRHFKAEFAPEGAPLRCTDGCPAADTCPYNAQKYYMGLIERGATGWPVNVLAVEPTEQTVMDALQNGPYGRCVYHCDNDVVDHQVLNMELEDGLTISFTMCAFTADNNRFIRIMGTHGEIAADMNAKYIDVKPFGKEKQTIDVRTLSSDFTGHSGGDARLLEDFLDLVSGEKKQGKALSSISDSVESHLVALAAERSRLHGGRVEEIRR